MKSELILNGDCIEKIKLITSNTIDAIVTDPPYELGFMGKAWDSTGIANSVELWQECLRVLKPGGHLLAFSGTRTYHRMTVAIEDAGFEVRDMIEWVYGSGFPKSLNIGKAVDKLQGNERETYLAPIAYPDSDCWGKPNSNSKGNDIGFETQGTGTRKDMDGKGNQIKTKGTSEWEGWGTALKPAHEPICMARKPLAEKTVAENCLKWGTGGINIDESRVGTTGARNNGNSNGTVGSNSIGVYGRAIKQDYNMGRFPANLIHDNSEEVRECFPESTSGAKKANQKNYNHEGKEFVATLGASVNEYQASSGNASRFFKGIPQVVDLHDFSIYNRSILTNIKQLCGQHLTKKKTDITLGGVIQEVEKFIQDAELLMFGNSTTIEKFLTDIVSITKTLIAQMTELKTLNVLPNWLIMKFMEESEKTISSLKELNTEDVKSAKSIFLLQTFISEVLESIRAIAEIVAEQDSNNGEYKSLLYQAKASKSNRGEGNNHATVKPTALMEYLINMVTREGQTVLDPFAGSGTTGVACRNLKRNFILIEKEPEYIDIIKKRLEALD